MIFFPTPYPDELLYSILARYCKRSGNINNIHNIEDLFGTRNGIVSVEMPSKLDALIENMPVNTKYTADYFIYNHTLFPFYAAFIPPKRAKNIINEMKSGDGSVSYMQSGVVASSVSLNRYFRFCPKCIKEDIQDFGEPYWHRTHQIAGIFICLKHKESLLNSTVTLRGVNRQEIVAPNMENCRVDRERIYKDELIEKMLWTAEDVETLLGNRYPFKEPEWFKSQFRIKLIEKEYARMNNFVYQKRLKEDFQGFYGEEYLELVQSSVSFNKRCWLTDLIRDDNRNTYALRYLLLARFLGMSIDDLFNKQYKITKGDNGEFVSSIDAYQRLWDEKVKELANEGLAINVIAKELQSTPRTIRRALKRMGIPEFKGCNKKSNHRYRQNKNSKSFKEKRDKVRTEWLYLHSKYPSKSSNQIRGLNDALYSWLYRNDRTWLKSHYRVIENKTFNVANWEKRDVELLSEVKKVVADMQKGKPQRITWSSIGGRLGIRGWFLKCKHKLVQTKEYVDSVVEDIQDFQVRKIKWAIEELERQGEFITKWKVVEKSGVKPKYMADISEEIQEILKSKGHI